MGTVAIGTVIGIVPDGETLAGWEIVATGDGRSITMKSGSCWGQHGDGGVEADRAWDAVTARLFARLSDADLEVRVGEIAAQIAARARQGRSTLGDEAALRVIRDEIARRKGDA